jgi:hypothetical protein
VLQLFFKLYYAFLTPLQIDCFAPNFLFKLSYLVHTVHECPLSVSLLGLPLSSDLLNSLKLSLLEPGFELLFLCTLPQFQLPDCLLCGISSIRVVVFLASSCPDASKGSLTSNTLVRLGLISARNLAKVLQV